MADTAPGRRHTYKAGHWFRGGRWGRMDAAKSTTVATTTDTHTTRTHSPDSRCITSFDMLFYAFLSRQPTSRRSLILSPPTLSPAPSRIQNRPYQSTGLSLARFYSARSASFITLSIPSPPTRPSAALDFWSCLYITLTFRLSLSSLLLFHRLSSLVESRRPPPKISHPLHLYSSCCLLVLAVSVLCENTLLIIISKFSSDLHMNRRLLYRSAAPL
ncbi:hypothetical protein FKP32DRAFT_512160 [Trametes sanguinea]|nr:hypothetical protein FKP32DRAFT_512160 [Trametes sanguinea]